MGLSVDMACSCGNSALQILCSSWKCCVCGPVVLSNLLKQLLLLLQPYACCQVKGLAHPGHWGGPLGPFFEQFGAVKAGPMTAYKLLKAGEQVRAGAGNIYVRQQALVPDGDP